MNGDGKTISWRGRSFNVAEGSLHPGYSLHTFEEEREFREEHWNQEEGDVVFDVGASYGAYALTACSAGATVHAFEPEPSVWADLMLNIEMNGWSQRCLASCIGLWSTPGEVDMRDYAPHWPQHTITGKYKVDTIDNVVQARKVVKMDWLKVDVEGAEVEVLRGAVKSLMTLRPKVIIEVHTFLDPVLLNKVMAALYDLDYDLVQVPRDPCVLLVGSPR